MSNFDNRIKSLLNEFLGDALGFAAGAASGFTSAATSKNDPVNDVIGAVQDIRKNNKENEGKPIGEGNPPKIGMYIKSKEYRDCIAKIIEISNNKVNFKIQLVGMQPITDKEMKSGKVDLESKEKPTGPDYVIVRTVSNGKWHIITYEYANKLRGVATTISGKRDQILKDASGMEQLTITSWAGKGTSFPDWEEYEGI
jgi:hypothetical protein